MYGRIIFI